MAVGRSLPAAQPVGGAKLHAWRSVHGRPDIASRNPRSGRQPQVALPIFENRPNICPIHAGGKIHPRRKIQSIPNAQEKLPTVPLVPAMVLRTNQQCPIAAREQRGDYVA
jgi:hypothetical protein